MARLGTRSPPWDRFAHWAPGAAILALALILVTLAGAAITDRSDIPPVPATTIGGQAVPAQTGIDDADLKLYERVAERVAAGENYYVAAVAEHRAAAFPLYPPLTVRLPTLAWISAMLGENGLLVAAGALWIALLAGWWWRLSEEPGGGRHIVIALLLLFTGTVAGLKPQYLALHEVWSGALLALALALHRTGEKSGHWIGAWIAAALALSIRELALPFVLLMGVMAMLRRDWREAGAWALLVAMFAVGLLAHVNAVDALTGAADGASAGWLALRGLAGWTGNIVLTSPLWLLPGMIAAPLALLPLIGWAGWKSKAGLTGFLFFLGYGVMFMIAGRADNFYWGLMIVPAYFLGLVHMPRALGSLWNSAQGH